MIELDINTRIIASGSRIWVLHAGANKEHFTAFRENSIVFLDLPKLDLTLDDGLQTPILRQKIERSLAWKEYLNLVLGGSSDIGAPGDELPGYAGSPTSRSLSTFQSTVVALFFAVKRGDLILVTSGRGQFGDVHFAEVDSEFDPADIYNVRGLPEYAVQFRHVRWLPASHKRRDINEGLAKRLENRRAAIEIDRRTFGLIVYSLAYENFSTGTISKTTLRAPRYASRDARDILLALQLTSWLIAAFEAWNSGNLNDINKLSIDALIKKYYHAGIVYDLSVEFSSPGIIQLIANNKSLAMFVSGAVVVLPLLAQDQKIDHITNSFRETQTVSDQGQSAAEGEAGAALQAGRLYQPGH